MIPTSLRLGLGRNRATDCRCEKTWSDPYRRAGRFRHSLLANYIRVGTQFASGKLTGRVPFDIYAVG